jgi:hypothetical protein
MNERIKELLNQATIDAIDATKDAVDFLDNPVTKQQRELQLAKFAELIVKKCAGIIESQDVDPAFKLRMSWAVKEHFGVKE